MRRKAKDPAQRLRLAVEALPAPAREAMLRGIDSNRIIVGAYVDPSSGGICPMLAAHRNGGRTSLASFARAWDRYTDARRPRLATRRELRTLRALLVGTLAGSSPAAAPGSIAEAAQRIRAEREAVAARCGERSDRSVDPAPERESRGPRDTGERHRGAELRSRLRWSWLRPVRRYDDYLDLLAAADEQLSETCAAELLGERRPTAVR